MKTGRLIYIDSIKGFAIYIMVFAHIIAWQFEDYSQVLIYNPDQPNNYSQVGFLWQLIYSFHMALFFLTSGYLSYKYNPRYINGVWKKTQRLLIPYFVTGIFVTLIRPGFGYWFLFSLWEISLLGYLLQFLCEKLNKKCKFVVDAIITIVFYYIISKLFSNEIFKNPILDVRYGINFFLPFAFGLLMRKYPFIEYICERFFSLLIIIFIGFFLLQYLSLENKLVKELIEFTRYIIGYFHITPILGSLTFFFLFKQGVNNKVEKILSYWGKNTLEIYLIHIFFVPRLLFIGDFWLQTNLPTCLSSQIIFCSVISLISIYISILLSGFLKRSKFLGRVMFGQ